LHGSEHGSTVGFFIQAEDGEENNLFECAEQFSHAYNVGIIVPTVKFFSGVELAPKTPQGLEIKLLPDCRLVFADLPTPVSSISESS